MMLIMGHRGARNEAPENTLAGFSHLRSLNIHCVELDLHLSQDHQLMVIHDDTLQRTTGLAGKISDYTADVLHQMDARYSFPKWPAFTGIPSLKQVLEAWPALKNIQLEVKSHQQQEYDIIIKQLDLLIKEFHLREKVTITSSNIDFLKKSMSQLSKQSHGYIAEAHIKNAVEIAVDTKCQALIAHHDLYTNTFYNHARKNKLYLSAWTVNIKEEMLRLHNLGIDFLITDEPSLALQILNQ